ncbi:MAG: abortive infection family protein [Ignavibacteriaceae bacterium]|nr:abortive infection family protein [Ignavibacteriaceae bacterium]
MPNQITLRTRRKIADALKVKRLYYSGGLDEPSFLSRLYNLSEMTSNDHRFKNAHGDIHKHTVLNTDWNLDWVFYDDRFNLLHCPDEKYLTFLSETLHPAVQTDDDRMEELLSIYNSELKSDGYEILQVSEMSGMPIFEGRRIQPGAQKVFQQQVVIKQYLNTSYIEQKIKIINDSLENNTDLAIGLAKELIETVCKSILKGKNVPFEKDWDVLKLIKETNTVINFKNTDLHDPDGAEKSIKMILGGISAIVHGVAELRNAYGTGHGKEANFKMLEPKYAKLIVGLVHDLILFYLSFLGEGTEVIDDKS